MVDMVCDNLTVNKSSKMLGDVDIQAKVIRLGLQKNGGGQIAIACQPNVDQMVLEAINAAGNGSTAQLDIAGLYGNNLPKLHMNADNTHFNGNVDIDGDVNIQAKVIRLGLQKNGGGQIAIACQPNADYIVLEACNAAGTGSVAYLQIAGLYGNNLPNLYMSADTTTFEGNINAKDVMLVGGDCAEEFDIVDAESIEPGTVMVIDNDGALRASEQAYDKRVAGVISGAGDLRPGITLDKQTNKANRLPLALTGKVYCKVDADCGAVEVGDLLTTSSTYGHAMKVMIMLNQLVR